MVSYRYSLGLVLGLLAGLLAVPASAQPLEKQRGYVMAAGGATMTSVDSPVFVGGVGLNLTPDIQVFADFGRMQDLLANFTRDDINAAQAQMLSEEGELLAITSKMPAVYATGGIRVLVPTGNRVRPYVTAGGGVARLLPKPIFVQEGIDITSVVMQEAEIRLAFEKRNRPQAMVGGGVTLEVARHMTVDIGYKYSRIFVEKDYLQSSDSPHQHQGFNVHRVLLGAGFVF